MFQEFDENDKSEEFLSDFRNKISQQSASSFQEKKEEIARSKNILIGALSGVVLAGVVGFVAFFPKTDGADAKKELPVIKRPSEPVKVQPSEPGGMKIENQDKSIYDIIEKKVDDTNKTVESILPPPEELKPIKIEEKAQVEEIIKEAEAKKETVVEAAKTVNIATAKEPQAVEPVKVVEKIEIPKPVVVEKPKPEPKKEEVKKPVVNASSVAKGMWQIQMMSSQNQKAINEAKTTLAKKYAPLKGVIIEVEEAYIAGKGTFYRLKAGNYKTKAEADKLCAELKALGMSCFAKKK